MKTLSLIISSVLLSTVVYAADFGAMSTDALLEKRGTMTTTQERQDLHNELKVREQTMSQEQLKKFNTYPPENRTRKYKNSGQGMGQGSGKSGGQGMGSKSTAAEAKTLSDRGPVPFNLYDTDGNNLISEDEFYDVRAKRMQKRADEGFPMRNAGNAPEFSEFDGNGDGVLSAEELSAGQQAQMNERRGSKGKGQGQGRQVQ